MRILKLLAVWTAGGALAMTLYTHGEVTHYWYGNDEGRGYSLDTWSGESLDDSQIYPKGYKFRFKTNDFERNSEVRTIAIILILSGACFLTFKLFRDPN